MYIKLSCDGVTIVAVERKYVSHILSVCTCSHLYPASNAHKSYYIAICGVLGPAINSVFTFSRFEQTASMHAQCTHRVNSIWTHTFLEGHIT